jgi:hypothetical protein
MDVHPAVGKREKHAEQAPGGACSALWALLCWMEDKILDPDSAVALPYAFCPLIFAPGRWLWT